MKILRRQEMTKGKPRKDVEPVECCKCAGENKHMGKDNDEIIVEGQKYIRVTVVYDKKDVERFECDEGIVDSCYHIQCEPRGI
tara:strand:- start:221 stop:469 length:249 start_codon:yes stop_codon:yes gene_type:complete